VWPVRINEVGRGLIVLKNREFPDGLNENGSWRDFSAIAGRGLRLKENAAWPHS
jgi:hypothetical protein